MATKAEQFHSDEQRKGQRGKARASKKKAKSSAWSRKSAHAGSKATRAMEETAPGKRPSRESTRGSANRAKADSAMNLTEEKRKGSPENRARKARVKGVKVRGSRP
ncbi:MAG TPA: hypothetical protein VIF09_23020 [Polyangiaceae bacterium]|jgi:hypothetical protein